MKSLLILAFFSTFVYADCDPQALKNDLKNKFQSEFDLTQGERKLGTGKVTKMVITDHILKIRNENFLVAQLKLDLTTLKGQTSSVDTLIAASIDMASCTLDEFQNEEILGSSVQQR